MTTIMGHWKDDWRIQITLSCDLPMQSILVPKFDLKDNPADNRSPYVQYSPSTLYHTNKKMHARWEKGCLIAEGFGCAAPWASYCTTRQLNNLCRLLDGPCARCQSTQSTHHLSSILLDNPITTPGLISCFHTIFPVTRTIHGFYYTAGQMVVV